MIKNFIWAAALGFLVAACSSGTGSACKTDSDCPPGRYCRPDGCAYDCTYDSDCLANFRCNEHGKCEAGCVKTNHGVEACDGLDNDCDGLTDEDFPDLGKPCQNGGCPLGVYVCKKDGSGVECNGRVPAADDSTCDGVDDDCDGQTDEDALPRPCPLQQGVCTGAMTRCVLGSWTACDYGPDYEKDVETRCDGLDNNCDGSTDEGALPSLKPESGAQAGDHKDNNCNGLVDEVGGVLVKAAPQAAFYVGAFEIGVFDNPDCSGHQYGVGADDFPAGFPADGMATVTLYACSLPGILPSGYLSYYRAQRACQAQGQRLCTDNEWQIGCTGGQALGYPYGSGYIAGMCNEGWSGKGQLLLTGSMKDCTAGNSTFDFVGNLSEWVYHFESGNPGEAELTGFSYQCEFCTDGASCRPCNLGSDLPLLKEAADCYDIFRAYERFPMGQARDYFGTRCCLDPP